MRGSPVRAELGPAAAGRQGSQSGRPRECCVPRTRLRRRHPRAGSPSGRRFSPEDLQPPARPFVVPGVKTVRCLGASLIGAGAELVTIEARFDGYERNGTEVVLTGLPDTVLRE